jgi:hypothetical protein
MMVLVDIESLDNVWPTGALYLTEREVAWLIRLVESEHCGSMWEDALLVKLRTFPVPGVPPEPAP